MYRKYRSDLIELRIELAKENGRECRLPIVTVDNVGRKADSYHCLDYGAREEGKSLAVVAVTVRRRTASAEIIFVINEDILGIFSLSLTEDTRVLISPA